MYKIIFVGDLNVYAKENDLVALLRQLGHRVTALTHKQVQDNKLGYLSVGFLDRILWKLGFQFDKQKVGPKLLDIVHKEKIDIVWIVKGNMINPSILKKLKTISPQTLLVSSSYDDMYVWHNRTWFYTFGLKHYDLVFTTKKYNLNPDELPRFGAKRVCFLYQSYRQNTHYPVALSEEDRCRYGAEVSFIGCYEKERALSILYLAQHGISVRVWGNGWEKFKVLHPNIKIECRPVVNDSHDLAYTKTICASAINLCFLRKMNRDLHTTRSVEIPACGGFMLAERTLDHLVLFQEGKEAAFFSDNAELLKLVKYYLMHPKERAAIAAAGRQRCLQNDYSSLDEVKSILKEVEKLL